jgi:hypothetical protein
VTIFARLLPLPAAGRPPAARPLSLAASLAAALTALTMLIAAPASAVVTTGVGPIKVGLAPRASTFILDGGLGAKFENPEGNPVLHGTNTYAVYWDPTDHYHGDWQRVIDTFFQSAGAASGSPESVFAVNSQYTDKTNAPAYNRATFRGAYTDTEPYPTSGGCEEPNLAHPEDLIGPGNTPVCLTSTQLATAVEAFVNVHGLQKGMNTVFYMLTPPGVTVCLDGGGASGHCSDHSETAESYEHSFCSYHAALNPDNVPTGDANTIVYGVIPWSAGGLGDNHMINEFPGWDCQDGGYNPASKPLAEEKEKAKVKSLKEEKEFTEKNASEKAAALETERLEGPHAQEPNQVVCPSSDGGCDTGLADLITNQIATQQQNIVTDPLLNAWQDPAHRESTDECRNWFAPTLGGSAAGVPGSGAGTLYNQSLAGNDYYLNEAFNLASYRLPYPAVPCLSGIALDPKFTAPNMVNVGDVVGFDGMESNISLNAAFGYSAGGAPQSTYAKYTWSFGDGSPAVTGYAPGAPACEETQWLSPCAASVFHAYAYGGTYDVALTVTDVGGNTATVTNLVTVIGPPPPPVGNQPGGPGSTAGAATPAAAGSVTPPVPNPVAAASVLSRTLRSATKSGVVVRYSVNEQVAGRFEVLLNSALARRLGISGSPAVGLPAGSAPQLVVAKAVIVTTTGGGSTMKIQFSKRTAQRLAKQRRVSFLLRMIVRNAASHPPASTTVLLSFTLTH